MAQAEPAKRYQALAAETASPQKLVLMLFDGALRFLAAAVAGSNDANLARRFESFHVNLVKAQKVLRELQRVLDLENGGEFAARMFALYDYMIRQLEEANRNKDDKPIQAVEQLLLPIRDAWAQMVNHSNPIAA